jgi:hypothetical protein
LGKASNIKFLALALWSLEKGMTAASGHVCIAGY